MIEMSLEVGEEGLEKLRQVCPEAITNAIAKSGKYLEAKVINKIDEQDSSWAPLSPKYLEWKMRHGYSEKTLVKTGQMFLAISSRMELEDIVSVGVFGETAKRAAANEYGAPAANIPERSFLRSTLNEEKDKIVEVFKEELVKNLFG